MIVSYFATAGSDARDPGRQRVGDGRAADDQLCALGYILTFPSQAANDEGESFGLGEAGRGKGEETYWYFVYVFCRATGVDPARCAAQTFAEALTARLRERHRERRRRRRRGGRGGRAVRLALPGRRSWRRSSRRSSSPPPPSSAAATSGGDVQELVAPGGYERPREMYEALNATLTSVRGSFLLVEYQLLGYAAFHAQRALRAELQARTSEDLTCTASHAHVLCAPLQVLDGSAPPLHIAATDPRG